MQEQRNHPEQSSRYPTSSPAKLQWSSVISRCWFGGKWLFLRPEAHWNEETTMSSSLTWRSVVHVANQERERRGKVKRPGCWRGKDKLVPAKNAGCKNCQCLCHCGISKQPKSQSSLNKKRGIVVSDELFFWSFLFLAPFCRLAWLHESVTSIWNTKSENTNMTPAKSRFKFKITKHEKFLTCQI